MSLTPEEMAQWPIDMLDQLQQNCRAAGDLTGVARVDAAIQQKGGTGVQTTELANSGRLFRHRHVDPESGRVTHSFTGDIQEFLSPFQTGATVTRIDTTLFTGANSPAAREAAAADARAMAAGRAALAADAKKN